MTTESLEILHSDLSVDLSADTQSKTSRVKLLLAGGVNSIVWVGVAFIGVAFLILAFTWGRVANTVNVGLQMPYLVSGGITALGLIVVGATLINAAVKRQDAARRESQIAELRYVLEDIRSVVEGKR